MVTNATKEHKNGCVQLTLLALGDAALALGFNECKIAACFDFRLSRLNSKNINVYINGAGG
ncbi:hypothetical protein [Campylobacter sp. 19-13652]|uniref:hypothetical protein n=1 Tax=Campylobacter sp. 19-13652 TaxID=2840180 RepID=UPI001C741AE8|nr:hypothetical protein [Campylobacter sp. 19-13652]BCX79901.1 hypothetical protein LBC_13630 [Campylobacter sp. 19-13652]